jgi:hypothetical protein
LLAPEAYQMVNQLGSNAFKQREPISMVYIIEQIQLLFRDLPLAEHDIAYRESDAGTENGEKDPHGKDSRNG